MNKPCLVNPNLIKKIRTRQNTGITIENNNIVYIAIGIFIGIVLMYMFNKKEQFYVNKNLSQLKPIKKKYKKSYGVNDNIYENEIDYRGNPHNIYTT